MQKKLLIFKIENQYVMIYNKYVLKSRKIE